MWALPATLSPDAGEQLTGIGCPDCSGVLGVTAIGKHNHLQFRCRVGHAYSITELLEAKEQAIEKQLWSATQALEEMAAFLGDLERHLETLDAPRFERLFRERAALATRHALDLRVVIANERPLLFGIPSEAPEPPIQPEAGA
jgi:hypothetical protein